MTDIYMADLHSQYEGIQTEIDQAIAEVIQQSAFIRGPYVERFEQQFAEKTRSGHCVSCANGTDALYIAMQALNVATGDEIITTAHSWIATSETITQAGGTIVFCDTALDSFTIDPEQIERNITPRTVGIIPVHLYGQPANMDAITAIAKKHGLWIIEDCAQAHLAEYKGKQVGSFGDIATYSFYPGKNLGAMGDAGAATTNDSHLAERMAIFARHGGLKKGEHLIEGINSRMDGLQAAILSVKLPFLKDWTKARQRAADHYDQQLGDVVSLQCPQISANCRHVYHLYVVKHPRRDELKQHLTEHKIHASINYPIALPFLKAYERFAHQQEEFPNAYANQSKILSLPLYAEISLEQQGRVIQAIKDFEKNEFS